MCGIFGIQGSDQAAVYTQLGLHGLQHRGQESAGIATADGRNLHVHRAMGLVGDVFKQTVLDNLPGFAAIGHVRYSTTGDSSIANAQPLVVSWHGGIAVAHNGNLVNAPALHRSLEEHGSIFQFTSDTEVILHLMAKSRKKNLVDRIAEALRQVRGAYSLLFLTPQGEIVAVRDPMGVRPLCIGRVDGAWVFSSEPVAFDIMDAEFVREVQPGEIVVASSDSLLKSYRGLLPRARRRLCVFEYVYFARPDAVIDGRSVDEIRKAFGRRLAHEQPVEADIVIAVPDSGVSAALGYAEASGICYDAGLTRSHYVGRTFIEPKQGIRHFGVKLKLNPIRVVLRGKRVAVIDDSLVRANTSRKIVRMVRMAGAKEVHLRISSPPNRWPCFYGIDTPSQGELAAASLTEEQIRKYVTADSLGYLSVKGMREAVGGGICDACFTGNYPIPVD